MRHHALRWAWLVLGLLLVAPAVHGQEREPVRIGIIYTNSGPLAQLGIDMRDGNLLYWNQAGNRAGGRRVELLLESTGTNKPDEGLTKARKLVERDRVHILTGVLETPVAYALASYVNEKEVPPQPAPERLHAQDGTKRRGAAEYADRKLFQHEPVLDVDSGRVHGHALLPRAERQVGEVKWRMSLLAGR
jgi:hypothetical protein